MAVSRNVVADKAREVEKDIVFKAREDARRHKPNSNAASPTLRATTDSQVAESPNLDTPRPSIADSSTPRASSVDAATPKTRAAKEARTSKYVSPMAKAREEKKRRAAASGKAKDWPNLSDMETSSTPSSSSTGSGSVHSTMVKKDGHLPKFGEWDQHSANSGPCYTLLFQNAAEQKKLGGPFRVHAHKAEGLPAENEDLYNYKPVDVIAKKKKKKQRGLFCCFSGA